MSKSLTFETVAVLRLDEQTREAFLQELGALGGKIFDGCDRDYYAAEFQSPHLADANVLLMRDETGRLVGYNMVRRFEYRLDGRKVYMFRAMAGLLKEFRRQGSTLNFGLTQAFKFKLAHPAAEVYFMALLLHPSSYYLFAKYAYQFWPTYKHDMPIQKYRLLKALCDAAGFALDDPDNPLILRYVASTIQNRDEATNWQADPRPEVQFYLKKNPRYAEGYALIGLAPLTFANLFITGAKFTATTVARRLGLAKRRR